MCDRLALVHEWLDARAGSELLFEQMAATFPLGDIFALTRSPEVDFDFSGRQPRTTWLDRSEAVRGRRSLALPVMPIAWKTITRAPYDVVITSTHAFGREFVRPLDGQHFNYVHAPMRYAWTPDLDPRGAIGGSLGGVARRLLRSMDLRSVANVDSFAANSTAVAKRIEQFYGRSAEVIHPPVDTDYFSGIDARRGEYLLAASRFVPYKRHDLAIRTAAKLDLPLVVAGSGPEEQALRDLASKIHPRGVVFEIQPPRARLRHLMANACAFVFPAHEDFGIVAVEAQAAGTPVIALEAGGSLDTVLHGQTGLLSPQQTVESFAETTTKCIALALSTEACRSHAEKFSTRNFQVGLRRWVTGQVPSAPECGGPASESVQAP